MAVVAFIGVIEETSSSPISGCGKTGSMVGVAYLDWKNKNKRIWSNFQTDFSEKICGLQEMIDTIGDTPQPDLILCISEMGNILNSLGSKTKQVLFIEKFLSQLRKLEIDLYWDTQRFKSIHLRLRAFTDIIFIPKKYHMDYEVCNYNLCKKPHIVVLYAYKPYMEKPRIRFNMPVVGTHYNSNEIITDTIIL
jgi:hypothetical protein